MSKIPRFASYAAAFEKAYESDDWAAIEPFFREDVVYEINLGAPLGGRFEGREAVIAYFKRVLDGFDRRFASREVALSDGPRESGDSVWIRGTATYRAPGVPELVLELEETATFAGDRIARLEDRYEPAMGEALVDWLKSHGARLGIDPGA